MDSGPPTEIRAPLSTPGARRIGLALILLATLVAYAPALRGGFIWDDDIWVRRNPTLKTVGGLARIWTDPGAAPQFYPLTNTSFWLEYRLWERRALGYHLDNILLHCANALLFSSLLSRLRVPGALLAAALFALHPVHVESVAWITERKNVLSLFFYLGAAHSLLGFLLRDESGRAGAQPRASYAAGALLYVAALLSKTVACTLPAALLVVVWWKRGRIERRDVAAMLPLLIAGACAGSLTAWLERSHIGAQGSDWSFSLLDRCLIAGRAVWFYASKLLVPARLTFIYPSWKIDDGDAFAYLFPAGVVIALGALCLLRGRLGRGPLAGSLLFVGTLVPALGFFDVFPMRYSFVADHWQYHASLGLIALGAAVATIGARRLGPAAGRGALAAAILVIAALGALTWRQCLIYKDQESLWRDTLAKNPDCWMAHTNLAVVLGHSGRGDEAIPHFAEALRLNPRDAEANNNFASALASQGRVEEAIAHYREAMRLQPNWLVPMLNLAALYATVDDPRFRDGAAAVELAERACRLTRFERPDALDVLGASYAAAGRFDEAVATAEQGLRLARAGGRQRLVATLEERLGLYRQGLSLHGAPPESEN